MRDIKFRAWAIDYKEMTLWDDLKEDRLPTESPGMVELMQYTGLKDKNGVEIYEGDIVTCQGGYDTNDCEDPGVVEWIEGAWYVRCELCGNSVLLYEFDIRGVIGNIYEHSELLKSTI